MKTASDLVITVTEFVLQNPFERWMTNIDPEVKIKNELDEMKAFQVILSNDS